MLIKVEQLRNYTYVIVDDNQKNGLKTKAVAQSFSNLHFLAMAHTYDDGLDAVLENTPDIVFLEIDPLDKDSKLSLAFINELHRYLVSIPKIFITSTNDALCLEAFKFGVFDYFINPLESRDLRKSLFRLEKDFSTIGLHAINPQINSKSSNNLTSAVEELSVVIPSQSQDYTTIDAAEIDNDKTISETLTKEDFDTETLENQLQEEVELITENVPLQLVPEQLALNKPLVICVKSYGDYRYIEAKDICYLQADNNSTDIHLNTGEMITAFKTLKHFEGVLIAPFIRIHNSYIVNIDYVSRIHTGNAVCHIKNTTTKLPFSKSYKENIDAIISSIASGNYLEI